MNDEATVMNQKWRQLVEMTDKFLSEQSAEDREQRMKTAMAGAQGTNGRWRTLVAMTDGILHMRRVNGVTDYSRE